MFHVPEGTILGWLSLTPHQTLCGQCTEHLLVSLSCPMAATLHLTYGRIVPSLFKGTALLVSLTLPMPPIKTRQGSLGSDPLCLIFCHPSPTWHSVERQEVEKKEVPQDSQDECVLTPSILQGSSDCSQPCSDGKFAFDESEVGPAPDGACGCSHAKEDEIPTGLPSSLHICSPHLCRLRKVISEDSPYRHILLKSGKRIYYETQTSGGSGSLYPFLGPRHAFVTLAPVSGIWTQIRCDKLSSTLGGNLQEVFVRPSLDQMCLATCNDLIFVFLYNVPGLSILIQAKRQTCIYIRRGCFPGFTALSPSLHLLYVGF